MGVGHDTPAPEWHLSNEIKRNMLILITSQLKKIKLIFTYQPPKKTFE